MSRQANRGAAALELVLGLPLLVLMFAIIFTVGSYATTRNEAKLEAVLTATPNNDMPWEASSSCHIEEIVWTNEEDLTKVLGPNPPLPPHPALVRAHVSREPRFATPPLLRRGLIPDVTAEHTTVAGAIDHRHIQFPDADDHPPLTPFPQVMYLSDRQDFALDAFRQLAEISAGSPPSKEAMRGIEKATTPMVNEAAAVAGCISVVSTRIRETERRLRDARAAASADTDLLEELEDQLESLHEERDSLRTAEEAIRSHREQLDKLHEFEASNE